MKNSLSLKITYFVSIICILMFSGCVSKTHYGFKKMYYSENELLHTEKGPVKNFLKAHHYNGSVYVFSQNWVIDTVSNYLAGNTILYGPDRKKIDEGYLKVHVDSIVIFETNEVLKLQNKDRIAGKAVITSLDVILGAICLSVPKACFGSCPTFYVGDDSNPFEVDGEGFSNAISPSLEYTDIDAMSKTHSGCKTMQLVMKNEALETHVVNKAQLMVTPKLLHHNTYHGVDDKFYSSNKEYKAKTAFIGHLDLSDKINEKDKIETVSLADDHNLVTKEEIILDFGSSERNESLGLVVTFRQTLMTTYMLYNAISYMGDEVSDIFAKLETENKLSKELSKSFFDALGGIEVYVELSENGKTFWEYKGKFYETGPIAQNTQLCPLGDQMSSESRKVKLIMNKGLWRIDQIKLVNMKEIVSPTILSPVEVYKNEVLNQKALNHLISDETYEISMPGDVYKIMYEIPCEAQEYDLFVQSKGYYIEWMRSNWLKDKNLLKLKRMIDNPKAWLKSETKNYKIYEAEMENQFWNSRLQHEENSYKYHELKVSAH